MGGPPPNVGAPIPPAPPIANVGGPIPPAPAPHGIGGGPPLRQLPATGDVREEVRSSVTQKIAGFLFTHKLSILSAGAMCVGAAIIIAATAAGGGIGIIVLGSLLFGMSAFFFVMAPWMNIVVDDVLKQFASSGMPDIPQPLKDLANGASNMMSHAFGALDSIGDKVRDWADRRGPVLPQ